MIGDFYKGKRVLVTGHTGFKGSYLCRMLQLFDADVYGYSLEPPTDPNLFGLLGLKDSMNSKIGDIRDFDSLEAYYTEVKPDIVIHMAAQPLVKEGYRDPRTTFETNVLGTVNILECARKHGTDSFLNVTTDKVYRNDGSGRSYSENDVLNGSDPYSNSKSCSDLITWSYANSFELGFPVSVARAGNVIGGGDFASDRIIPDCVRAMLGDGILSLLNPTSIRPYQHVFKPLYAYLTILKKQFEDHSLAGCYNIGPDAQDIVTTEDLVKKFCRCWGKDLDIEIAGNTDAKEMAVLRLDNSKLKKSMGITPVWGIEDAVSKVVEWTKAWSEGIDVKSCTDDQIREYLRMREEDF